MMKKNTTLLSFLLIVGLLVLNQFGFLPSSFLPETESAPPAAQSAVSPDELLQERTQPAPDRNAAPLDIDGSYDAKDDVALYLHTYRKLPSNFITKAEAEKLGFDNHKKTLDVVAPGFSIGGDHFGNYEGLLPEAQGRTWRECDIDYHGGVRGAKRIVFSSDGLIYYTGDHYKTFDRLY